MKLDLSKLDELRRRIVDHVLEHPSGVPELIMPDLVFNVRTGLDVQACFWPAGPVISVSREEVDALLDNPSVEHQQYFGLIITHELVHYLHYRQCPGFFMSRKNDEDIELIAYSKMFVDYFRSSRDIDHILKGVATATRIIKERCGKRWTRFLRMIYKEVPDEASYFRCS